MDIPAKTRQDYHYLQKGYEGEVQFDKFATDAGLDQKFLILNDLFLNYDNNKFQIDSTIITQRAILLSEIKNFEGDYYYQDRNFHYNSNSPNNLTKNPLEQLNRNKILLGKLLFKNGFNLAIDGNVVFINPEFFLYQAPRDEPIVYRPQLNKFIQEINSKPANLNGSHIKLAEMLVSHHIADASYLVFPAYDFNSLKKGNKFKQCFSFSVVVDGRKLVCADCGHVEKIEAAIVRSVGELRLLFPDMKITTAIVYEWCGLPITVTWVWKILKSTIN
ncbi:nuclease-related domain-containing protein [Bacillus marasmi]|uniref:nuclease-related domain-containing protein n=1 Tax=Bacillus marasmi TaxID=1926279 RepID=UPI0011CB72F8|nr:nuclease-related domain-containing protein [Bacillus marasmi]